MREAGIVIGRNPLEPRPALAALPAIQIDQLGGECLSRRIRGSISRKASQLFVNGQQSESPCSWRREGLHDGRQRGFEELSAEFSVSFVLRAAECGRRCPKGARMAVLASFLFEPAKIVAHEI